MALIEIKNIKPSQFLGIWQIEESEEFFKKELQLDSIERAYLANITYPRRRLEWLSSRLLIRRIVKPAGQILMEWDKNGKPFVTNYDFEVAISHSQGMAAVLVGQENLGLDIERDNPRILKIAHKFTRRDEEDFIPIREKQVYSLALWCAKEALFKKLGGGGIDFKEHMRVHPFTLQDNGTLSMTSYKGQEKTHLFAYRWVSDYLLVYSK